MICLKFILVRSVDFPKIQSFVCHNYCTLKCGFAGGKRVLSCILVVFSTEESILSEMCKSISLKTFKSPAVTLFLATFSSLVLTLNRGDDFSIPK